LSEVGGWGVGGEEGQFGENTGQVTLRIDVVTFGRGDQRPESSLIGRGRVMPGEELVFPANGQTLQRPFSGVVIDVQIALRVSVPLNAVFFWLVEVSS